MAQLIYKIVNLVNDKFYVGSTTSKKVRFRQHRKLLRGNRHHCTPLQYAWNKYGESKFSFIEVEEVPVVRSLQEIEDIYLAMHVGKEYCYNVGRGSNAPWRNAPKEITPNFGKAMLQAQKDSISKTLKAFYAEDYYNHPRVGKLHTEESKKKISDSRVGKGAGKDHYRYGLEVSDEVRKKIGDAQRGVIKAPRVVSEAGMARIKEAAVAGHYSNWEGKKHSMESRIKMSKAVTETTTNMQFNSLTETLQYYGMKMPTLCRALEFGKPISKGKFTGLHFVYGKVPLGSP